MTTPSAKIPVLLPLAMVALAGTAPAAGQTYEDYKERASIELPGAVRNFDPVSAGGHVDFGASVELAGRYAEVVEDSLDAGRKPVFRSQGSLVTSDWKDASSRSIMPSRPYIEAWAGDVPGSQNPATTGAVRDASSFSEWFSDSAWGTPSAGTFTLGWNAVESVYRFDGTLDDLTGAADHTYTFEAGTTFVYEEGKDWFFEVETDGDAWVFIDGRLVIDGGSGSEGMVCAGIATDGPISLQGTAQIDVAPGSRGLIATNATSSGAVKLLNSARIEANVRIGPGGNPSTAVQGAGGISGRVDALSEPVPMPSIPSPTGLPPKVTTVAYDGNATGTISSSVHCDEFLVKNLATLRVEGNVVVRADKLFLIDNHATVTLNPGATFTVYAYDVVQIQNYASINENTADPGRMTIYNMGSTTMVIDNNTVTYANIMSPNAELYIGNSAHLHGAYLGRTLFMQDDGHFTVDAPGGCTGVFSAAATPGLPAPLMTQRIDLDRLGWLQDKQTHRLDLFFANRRDEPSALRMTTDIWTLRLANFQTASKVD
jgi:hypothetical protein